ncbi:DUF445 domain-containing protein [Aestuariibacter sp. A3R04]|uniref:DUF445 domain-containing protein n=1 Tax=Aestuariibacter sp. A3R04 TaxID=2841571 RepID=UPI001C091305|nr:DUF445 family protein [Aestuariibacter sp. A3R04]MBU3022522.1 DUF445 family protein [Aestuariibacter sp. A3R04]
MYRDKTRQLARAKRIATAWLVGAALLFVFLTVTQAKQWLSPWPVWAGMLKMASEAALIGGLADWFAVTALFKPIPARWPIPHTNIVARNKKAVATNLSGFVKEKFFNDAAIDRLIRTSQPAQGVAKWLLVPRNSQRASQFITGMLGGVVNILDDKPVQKLLVTGVKRAFRKVDMAPVAAGTLRVLTGEQRHQDVLDQVLLKVAELAERPASEALIAEKLHEWLKLEYRRIELVLPTGWISEQGARIASKALVGMLLDIAHDKCHPIRKSFDTYLHNFIANMENDPDVEAKLVQLREQLLENEKLQHYLLMVWQDMRTWLVNDVAKKNGKLSGKIAHALEEVGRTVERDEALATAVNSHISDAARYSAPAMADFLTDHIRKTILAWDDEQMAEQIELNIGKDLQKVRINGTLVGGAIGAALFVVEYGISYL